MQVALFGLIFLGDTLTPLMAVAILIATAGVVVMSLKPGAGATGSIAPTLIGLGAGAHVRAVGDRLSRRDPDARACRIS